MILRNKLDAGRRCLAAAAILFGLAACAPAFMSPASAQAQTRERLDFRKGKSVAIDGVISDGEWADAATMKFSIAPGWEAEVRYKHDGANLLFAFLNMKAAEGSGFRTAEVLVDAANDKTPEWNGDDWWFHASARDCVNRGKHEDYSTCRPSVPEMEASNGAPGELPRLYEVRIPFDTVGLKSGGPKTLGMAIDVTDTQRNWEFWPAKAQMRVPASWGEAVSSDNWTAK